MLSADHPLPNPGLDAASERLASVALVLLALSLYLAPAGVSAASVLLWAGFIGQLIARWRGPGPALRALVRCHPLVLITILFTLYGPLQTLALRLLSSGGPTPSLGQALDWAQLSILVPAAFVVAARPARLPWLLLVALTGLIAGMLLRLDWPLLLSDPPDFFDSRHGFGFGAIAFGLFSGTALLGLILLRRRCWLGVDGLPRWGRLLLWAWAAALVLQGFVMAQSRGAWIAFLLALATGLALQWRRRSEERSGPAVQTRATAILGGLMFLAVLAIAIGNGDQISERFTQTLESARSLATVEGTGQAPTSLSLRWHAQLVGAQAVSERPWLGWGAGTTRALMDASGHPAVRYDDGGVLKHLHNGYLEAAVELGLIGLGLFLAIHLGLIASLLRQLGGDPQTALVHSDLLIFLISALVLLLVWDLFDSRMIRQDWRAHWTLLAGAALGLGLRPLGARR